MGAAVTAAAPQHMQALARANTIRLARAALKQRIASGELSVGEVILAPPPEAESWTMAGLLMAQDRWGRTRMRRFLASVPMSETKELRTLTERQRKAVAGMLDGSVPPNVY